MRARSTSVSDYCVRSVVTAERDTPVARCARMMHDEHVGCVVVVESRDGRRVPVGMLTDRDIAIEVVAFGIDPSALTAGDVMTGSLATIRAHDDLLAALAVMREHGVRRLPVVDSHGALHGIVSADNLVEMLAGELDGLVSVIEAEQTRERVTRASRPAG
ncbi:MAG: CBS domain-containing protein [Burkholderiaceae bacterium]